MSNPVKPAELAMGALALAAPLAIYNLVLIERKFSVVSRQSPFLQGYQFEWAGTAAFIGLFAIYVLVFVLSAASLLLCVLSRASSRRWITGLSAGIPIAVYFGAITLEFEVYRYFRDSLDFAMVRGLGGGSLRSAIRYVTDELVGVLPLIFVAAVLLILGGWISTRFGRRLAERIGQKRLARVSLSPAALVGVNILLAVLPIACIMISPGVHHALSYSLAYRLYSYPAMFLTDLDGDGYGLLSRPRDQALFDANRYPYALDLPGNGIDENGVGGDLPEIIWKRPIHDWDPDKLERKSVLLIVLESARADLLEAEVDGHRVMPALAAVPGHPLQVYSHLTYSPPSIFSLLLGTLARVEKGISLIHRFQRMGYRTGVFSGQHEGFGEKATKTAMHDADVFYDASTAPRDKRMYSGTAPASLKVPASIVNTRFLEWLDTSESSQPFFAYVNWQETHFPYSYPGIRLLLIDKAIPRSKITEKNRDRLVRTYMNAANNLDEAFDHIVSQLSQRGLWEDTVVLVTGDHGESLFDQGLLGHGLNLSLEQNATVAKLINSIWQPPLHPIGLSDIGAVIHNALAADPASRLSIADEVFCYVGAARKPREIGLVTEQGLLKYNFRENRWLFQDKRATSFVVAEADPSLIHLWESYVWHLREMRRQPSFHKE